MQHKSNVYIALAFSLIKGIDKRKSFDLEFNLEQKIKTFRHIGINMPLAVNELPLNFFIESMNVIEGLK